VQYIYNSRTGAVSYYSAAILPELALLHSGLGWHGPFDTKEDITKYYNDNKAKNPGWKSPSSSISKAVNNIPSAIGDQTNAATTGLGLSDKNIQSWLIRIGEIVLGIVLVGVGLAKLTGTSNVVSSIVKAKIP
jgi:hypothetical protein